MLSVQRTSHATYEIPDLARQIDYYTQVIGLRLAECGRDRAILMTRRGEEARK
jgi:catechol-2,3-dioxygenase